MECSARCGRRCAPCLLGTLLILLYGSALFFDPVAFMGRLSPCFAQPGTTPEEVWKATSTQIKGAVLQTGGWALGFATTILYLGIRDVGGQGLCRGIAIAFLSWQLVWYGAIFPVGNVTASQIFVMESLQEIVFISIFGYLGCIAPSDSQVKKLRGRSMTAKVRAGLLVFMPTLLIVLQTSFAFFHPENYVTMEAAMLDPKGQDAAKVWETTPSQAKSVAIEQAGWIFCIACVMYAMMIFEPSCDRDLCVCWVMIFINWTAVWYGSCMRFADVDGDYQVPWTAFFKAETLGAGELPFTIIFSFLGFTPWCMEENLQQPLLQG